VILLALDTSGATASAAVMTGTGIGLASCDVPRAHARVLPGLIVSAAESAGVPVSGFTHVAVARGPGLFTGMRVGLVTAEMFALAAALPLAGVSTLHALAHRVLVRHRPPTPFAVLVDARRREVFAQSFAPSGDPIDEARALAAADIRGVGGIPREVPDDALFVDAAALPGGFSGRPLPTAGLAAEIAAVAAERWRNGAEGEPATPLYLRRPDTSRANPARSVLGSP